MTRSKRLTRLGTVLLPLLVFTAVTVAATWPMAAQGTDHIFCHPFLPAVCKGDLLAITWIFRWDVHALATNPFDLFNANAFHPAPNSLAGTEHLLGGLPTFGIFWLLSGNPIASLNGSTLLSFILGGWFMYLLVRKWTGSSTAAYIAGLCFCLAPLRFGPVVGQPHILATQYYPLILLTLDQAVRGRIRAGVVAGLLIALQCLVSFYLAYQVLMIIGALLLAVVVTQGFSWITKRSCAALLLAGLIAVIPVVAVSLPYLEARAGGSITAFEFGPSWVRGIPWYSLGTHVGLMASALGIAALPFLVHAWISGRLRMAQRMLACVMICLAAALLWRGPILSLPSWLDPYSWLATVLPGFSSLRGTQRFAVLGSFGLSVLAGFSVAGGLGLLRRFSVGGWIQAAFAGSLIAAAVYTGGNARHLIQLRVPVGESVPEVHHWLAKNADSGSVLELPARADALGSVQQGLAMYHSTYHWRPILNGRTSYYPAAFGFLMQHAAQLPDAPGSLRILSDCADLRWIVVHGMPPSREKAWSQLKGVRRIGVYEPGDTLFEVVESSKTDCKSRLFDESVTLAGHPAEVPQTLDGRMTIGPLPATQQPGASFVATVVLENTSSQWWPGATIREDRRVELVSEWVDTAGEVIATQQRHLLPRDLEPDQIATIPIRVSSPATPGPYRLRVLLARGDMGTALSRSLVAEVDVRVSPRGKR